MKGTCALVIGLGVSGCSAARFLLDRGARVVGYDQHLQTLGNHPELAVLKKRGARLVDTPEAITLSSCHLVVVSPGVPRDHLLYRQAMEKGIEVIGEIELACRHLSEQTFLGITGTNGKTTVALLVGHVLKSCGRPARVLGNVGDPLTSALSDRNDETIVCELSSFQLETMQSRVVDGGVIVNIAPDHLDRYTGMEEYAAAKIRLMHCLKPGANLYVEERAYQQFAPLFHNHVPMTYGYSPACDLFTDKNVLYHHENIEYLLPDRYRGMASHDMENVMAAFALCCRLGVDVGDFDQALQTFTKPPHRMEFVTTIRGVHVFNDSKATNIHAVIRGVESMRGKVVLIAGGMEKKGVSYLSWKGPFGNQVKGICAIGQAKEKMQKELSRSYPVHLCSTLEDAVHQALAIAEPGDNVLFSPGGASFDMFRNFAHRGEEFKRMICKEAFCHE